MDGGGSRQSRAASRCISASCRISKARILSGEWRPGYRLPFEHELTSADTVVRGMTVNKVMTQLAKAGLIERRRRAGSFVTRPHSQSAVLAIQTPKAEVQALGLPYRHEIVLRSRRKSTPADRRRLGLSALRPRAGARVPPLRRPASFLLRGADHQPRGRAGSRNEIDFTVVAPGTWLVERVPWSAAENKIRAVGADAAEAEALQVAGRDAVPRGRAADLAPGAARHCGAH